MKRFLAAAACLAVSACVLGALDLEGRPCDANGQCVAPDLCDLPSSRCWGNDSTIHIDDFRAAWVTANGVYWTWKLSSSDPSIDLSTAARAIRLRITGPSNSVVIDSKVNGELDLPALTGNASAGQPNDPVVGTYVGDLTEQTTYTGELFVQAPDNTVSASGPVLVTTQPRATGTITFFDDSLTALKYYALDYGAGGPGEVAPVSVVATGGVEGGYGTTGTSLATGDEWWNLHLDRSALDTSPVHLDSPYKPYLEFALRIQQAQSSLPYAEVRLFFQDCPTCGYMRRFTAQRDGAFRIYQLPLTQFANGTFPQTALDAGWARVLIGTQYPPGAKIDFDIIRIRYY